MKALHCYMRILAIALFFLFPGMRINAQTVPIPTVFSFTPNGVFDSVFDQYGNAYQLKDIAINDTLRTYGHDTLVPLVVSTYSSGYFKLYLDRNCGMENYATDTNHLARLLTICQMLKDVSQFINSPCNSTDQTINIWCRDIGLIPNLPVNRSGVITSFYNIPLVSNLSGIVDNTVWKTLNSGVDAYKNIGAPWNSDFQNGKSFFHAVLAFDFNSTGTLNWNTSLTSAPASDPTVHDLYTESLHQMMHALGFASLISSNGNSLLGATHPYYSRYDMNLKTSSGTPLLSHTGSVSMYNYSFGVSTSVLAPGGTCYTDSTICSTGIKYYGGLAYPQTVYTPNCFEPGISISHFEDQCLPSGSTSPMVNNQYFLMSNITNAGDMPGSMKRHPQPEEQQVLADIGYSVNGFFGDSSDINLNYVQYDSTFAATIPVTGINDGIDNGAYTFTFDSTGTLTFNGSALLGNDSGVSGGSFEGLQMIYGSGMFSASSGTSGTTIMLTGAGGGVNIFSYVPVSATGVRGNIAGGPLAKTSGICSTTPCNLVPNPGYESATGCGLTVPFAPDTLSIDPIAPATAIIDCWSTYMGTPDLYSTGCTTISPARHLWSFNVPNTMATPTIYVHQPPLLPPATTNNNFLALFADYGINFSAGLFETEAEQASFTTSIGPGTYTISLWAKVVNVGSFYSGTNLGLPGTIGIGLSNGPLTYTSGYMNNMPATFYNINANLAVPGIPDNDAWTYLTYTFTITGSYTNLIIFNAINKNSTTWPTFNYPMTSGHPDYSSYIGIDDIQLVRGTVHTFILPATVAACTGPLTNLGQYISGYSSITGGTFYGPGVTQTSNGTFSPSALTGTLPQTVQLSYVYTDPTSGCLMTIASKIKVINSTANVTASPNPLCSGGTVTLTTTGCSTCNWTWPPSGSCSSCGATITKSPTASTTYTVYDATSSNCAGSVTVNLFQASIGKGAGSSYICVGATGPILYAFPANPSYTYTWEISYDLGSTWSTYAGPTVGLSSINPTITTAGVITMRVKVNNGTCTSTSLSTINLIVNPLPVATLTASPTSICANAGYITLHAGPVATGYSYSYNGGAASPYANYTTPSITGTTNYSVKVTDVNGCQATAGPVAVTYNAVPTITASAAPTGVCVGIPVSLTTTSTGATSFLWTPATGAGAVACATCANTTATPVAGTNLYTVTATGTGGCTATAHVTVPAGTPPAVTTGSTLTTVYGGQSTLIFAFGPVGATYTWTSVPAATLVPPSILVLNASGSEISATPAPGSMTSSVTYTVVATLNGCSSTASTTISVTPTESKLDICTAATIFAGQASTDIGVAGSTTTTYYPPGAPLPLVAWPAGINNYVHGTFHLRGNFTISNARFWMAPATNIIIDEGSSITFSNCHFFTCLTSSEMWNGIVFGGSTGSVYLTNNTMIEDANIGIATSGTTPASGHTYVIRSDGATFNRCTQGIDMENYNSLYVADMSQFLSITNTVFTSRNFIQYNNGAALSYPLTWPPVTGASGLKNAITPADSYSPPYNIVSPTALLSNYAYPLINTKSSGPCFYGIHMNLVGISNGCYSTPQLYSEAVVGSEATSTARNLFDNLGAGIYLYNSNLSAYNNTFMNMNYLGAGLGGDGIYTNQANYCGRLRVWNNGGAYQNEFYDCVTGVDAPNQSDMTVQNCKIISKLHNIAYLNSAAAAIPGNYGVNFHAQHVYNLDVSYNTITNVTNGINAMTAMPTTFGTGPGGPMNISNNTIQASAGSGVANPFVQQAIAVQTTLHCNSGCTPGVAPAINTNTLTNVYNGIYLSGFAQQYLNCTSNNIALAVPPGQPAQYGINIAACTDAIVFNNVINGPAGHITGGSAVYAYADDQMRGIYATMNTGLANWCNTVNNVGRGFEFAATNKGTQWANNLMQNTGKGYVLSSNGAIDQQVTTNSVPHLPEAANNIWQLPTAPGLTWSSTYPQTYGLNSVPGNSILLYNPTVPPPPYTSGTYMPNYNSGSPALSSYALGVTIQLNKTSIGGCGKNIVPYPITPAGPWKLASLVATAQLPYYQNTATTTWIDQMGLWQTLLTDTTIIDANDTLSEFVSMAAASRYKALTDIEATTASGDLDGAISLISTLPAGSPANDPVTGVTIADNAAADYIVANYTSYYNLYIRYAQGFATAYDSLQLLGLAGLCPFTNGAVVYQARSLYDAVSNTHIVYADDRACGLPYGSGEDRMVRRIAAVTTANTQSYSLYPNPNDGNLNLLQTVADANPVYTEVWDGAGRLVYKQALTFSGSRAQVKMSNVPPGMYLIQLRDSSGKYYTFKFAVEKQ